MPVCTPRGCACQFTSSTLTIFPDSEDSNLIHVEQAEFSDITEMQADIAALEASMAAALADISTLETDLATAPADIDALEALVPGAIGTYTPALTGATTNPNLGTTGTALGRYARAGKFLFVQTFCSFGGTGIAQGSGTARISLPPSPLVSSLSAAMMAGVVTVRDSSASQARDFRGIYSGGLVLISPFNAAAFASFASQAWESIGITFAAGDLVTFTGWFYIP